MNRSDKKRKGKESLGYWYREEKKCKKPKVKKRNAVCCWDTKLLVK